MTTKTVAAGRVEQGKDSARPSLLLDHSQPSVVSPQERGKYGNMVLRARYPKRTLNAWAHRGGRKPNRTLAQIEAGIFPKRAQTRHTPVRITKGGSASQMRFQ